MYKEQNSSDVEYKYQISSTSPSDELNEKGASNLVDLERVLPEELLTIVSIYGGNYGFRLDLKYKDVHYKVFRTMLDYGN